MDQRVREVYRQVTVALEGMRGPSCTANLLQDTSSSRRKVQIRYDAPDKANNFGLTLAISEQAILHYCRLYDDRSDVRLRRSSWTDFVEFNFNDLVVHFQQEALRIGRSVREVRLHDPQIRRDQAVYWRGCKATVVGLSEENGLVLPSDMGRKIPLLINGIVVLAPMDEVRFY